MKLIYSCLALCLSIHLFGQNTAKYWQVISPPKSGIPLSEKSVYQSFKLDVAALQTILQQKSDFLSLPLPDGATATLQIEETAVMNPALASRYPNIRSFQGVSKMARVDLSPYGFHAMMEYQGRTIYIDPLKNQPNHYISYYMDEVDEIDSYSCATLPNDEIIETNEEDIQTRSTGVDLRIYRLAVACTGEFTQQFGGTKESALATVVSAVNRLNYIYGRELGVNFQLGTHNDQLIFTDPETDPFPTTDQISDILSNSISIFRDSLHLSPEEYDIGHIFVVNCDGANGIAHPSGVCRSNRFAVTCFTSNNLDAVVTSIFAHEVGHQFGATHTFSASCNANQVNGGTQVEPFCGYTIMSYNTTDKRPYFHGISLEQMTKLIRFRAEEGCGTSISTDNQYTPILEIKYLDLKTIPKETPFELTAIGTDADGDSLTYSWEQIDNENAIYRSDAPSPNPVRSFPALSELLSGTYNFPDLTSSRDLTFRCTVRDNNPEGGAITWRDVSVRIVPSGESFQVISPNSDTVVWQGGSQVEVRWKTVGTNINSQLVNISLSLDGGYTYPIILAKETPNNGLAIVNLPDVTSEQARVRVEAADNIFFNISKQNFRIKAATEPTFLLDATPRIVTRHCSATPLQFTINLLSIKGFTGEITLSLEGNLPPGTTYAFMPSKITPSQSSTLTIYFTQSTGEISNLLVKASATNGLQGTILIQYSLIRQDVTEPIIFEPAENQLYYDGSKFSLFSSGFAIRSEFEIATSPAFGETVIYHLETVKSLVEIQPSINFEPNRLYFWHVRPIFECGEGVFSTTNVFSTDLRCRNYEFSDTMRMANNLLDLLIQLPNDGTVEEIDLPSLQILNINLGEGTETSPKIDLISPSGNTIKLLDRHCTLSNIFLNIQLQDDLLYDFSCFQITSSGYVISRPAEPFRHLRGEKLGGVWRLRLEYPFPLDSLYVEAYPNLQICKQIVPSPTLVQLDTLFIAAKQLKNITSQNLASQDSLSDATHVSYLLIATPRYGTLLLAGRTLQVGERFTQQEINDLLLQYRSEIFTALSDSFHFLVQNEAGRILPIQSFYIKIEQGISNSTATNLSPFSIKTFPNPAKDLLNIQLDPMPKGAFTLILYNVQGQEVQRTRFDNANNQLQLSTSQLPGGLYFLTARTAEGMVTKKVTVQK